LARGRLERPRPGAPVVGGPQGPPRAPVMPVLRGSRRLLSPDKRHVLLAADHVGAWR
jgi:hypothetical protein